MIIIHTSMGDIKIELEHEKAPMTCANFLRYARGGFYDGTVFHRVIDGFMIQGGGFEPGMVEKPTHEQIRNEAENGLSNATGTLAMARTGEPHSATAQFFINVTDNTRLDFTSATPSGWGYCVFARIAEGMDTVDQIKSAETGFRAPHGDVPVEDIIIEQVEVIDEPE
ncbi:MAG: peptidylprolyl isomerase [Gammaproteobacteria bacterium]|nr:MAG: peptidylprolyl isomerase [Gammaproteobacteria bacterium]